MSDWIEVLIFVYKVTTVQQLFEDSGKLSSPQSPL